MKSIIFLAGFLLLNMVTYFYNEWLYNGIVSLDFTIISIIGTICLIYYAYNSRWIQKSFFLLCFVVVSVLNLLLINNNVNSFRAINIFICLTALFCCLQRVNKSEVAMFLKAAVFISFGIQVIIGIFQGVKNNWAPFSINGWLHNSGFYGNYLACIIPSVFSFILGRKEGSPFLIRILVGILLFVSCFLLIATFARAAILGTLTALIFVIFFYYEQYFKIKNLAFAVGFLSIVLVTMAYGLKRDSTSGRLTIYQVSLKIFKDNWLTGVGPGNFSSVYNNYQSDYFRNNPTSIKTQLLADNTFEAFNLPIQVLVEFGLIGFFLITGFLFHLFKRYSILKRRNSWGWVEIGSFSCLLASVVSSFFSNPYHVTPILLILTIHLAIICQLVVVKKNKPNFSNLTAGIIYSCTAVYIIIYGATLFFAQRDWGIASELSKYGKYTLAKKYYESAYRYLKYDGRYLFNYGSEAYLAGEVELSIRMLNRASYYISSNNIFSYLGDAYTDCEKFGHAEINYLRAIYMVPSHLLPKYKLIHLYKKWGKYKEANIWRRRALSFPIKIKTELTDELLFDLKNDF